VHIKGCAVILCQRVCRQQGCSCPGIGVVHTLLVQTGLHGQNAFHTANILTKNKENKRSRVCLQSTISVYIRNFSQLHMLQSTEWQIPVTDEQGSMWSVMA
jgi:hypothetical protein